MYKDLIGREKPQPLEEGANFSDCLPRSKTHKNSFLDPYNALPASRHSKKFFEMSAWRVGGKKFVAVQNCKIIAKHIR